MLYCLNLFNSRDARMCRHDNRIAQAVRWLHCAWVRVINSRWELSSHPHLRALRICLPEDRTPGQNFVELVLHQLWVPFDHLFVFNFAHNITSEWGGMQTDSVVSAKHSVAAWKRCNCMVSYPPPDKSATDQVKYKWQLRCITQDIHTQNSVTV